MTNIINITTALPITSTPIGNLNAQTVDARNLHDWLGVGRDFTSWIRNRIAQYGFTAGSDYLLTKTGEKMMSGTKFVHQYALTLGMAKELAMVERNDQGRAARKYFIDMEKQHPPNGCRYVFNTHQRKKK